MGNKYKLKQQEPVMCKRCEKEFVLLRDNSNRKVRVLFESLDIYEKSFVTEAGEVEFDRTRHKRHRCEL
jgi:hypothetical protein